MNIESIGGGVPIQPFGFEEIPDTITNAQREHLTKLVMVANELSAPHGFFICNGTEITVGGDLDQQLEDFENLKAQMEEL